LYLYRIPSIYLPRPSATCSRLLASFRLEDEAADPPGADPRDLALQLLGQEFDQLRAAADARGRPVAVGDALELAGDRRVDLLVALAD